MSVAPLEQGPRHSSAQPTRTPAAKAVCVAGRAGACTESRIRPCAGPSLAWRCDTARAAHDEEIRIDFARGAARRTAGGSERGGNVVVPSPTASCGPTHHELASRSNVGRRKARARARHCLALVCEHFERAGTDGKVRRAPREVRAAPSLHVTSGSQPRASTLERDAVSRRRPTKPKAATKASAIRPRLGSPR